MILVVSHGQDIHATEVLGHLASMNAEAAVLDLSQIPMGATLTIDYQQPAEPIGLLVTNGHEHAVTSASAIWWRRPTPFAVPDMGDPEALTFTHNEWEAATSGLWQLAPALWVNEPNRDMAASRKAFQLAEAERAGLKIPRTMITSDPDRARRFIDGIGRDRTVYKVFSATNRTWRETRLLRESELELLEQLRLAPVIFQEFVPAEVDLRVTIVGDRCFPSAIHSHVSDYKVDFRVDMDRMEIEETSLPEPVEQSLRLLMQRLGLVYGAIDMRRTPDGEHIFLEVNTAGQWLFVEYQTKQPIAETLAAVLAGATT